MFYLRIILFWNLACWNLNVFISTYYATIIQNSFHNCCHIGLFFHKALRTCLFLAQRPVFNVSRCLWNKVQNTDIEPLVIGTLTHALFSAQTAQSAWNAFACLCVFKFCLSLLGIHLKANSVQVMGDSRTHQGGSERGKSRNQLSVINHVSIIGDS